MIQRVRLDSKHRYFIGGPGAWVRKTGFTEICTAMGVIVPSPFYTEQGRAEGKAIHEWLQWLARGKPERVPHPSIAARVEQIKAFLRDSKFKIVGGETPQYDPKVDACVTPDLWGFIGEKRYVLDAKRGGPLPYHAIQTAAQAMALKFAPEHRATLYLRNGSYRLKAHEDAGDFKRWRSICKAYHAAKGE